MLTLCCCFNIFRSCEINRLIDRLQTCQNVFQMTAGKCHRILCVDWSQKKNHSFFREWTDEVLEVAELQNEPWCYAGFLVAATTNRCISVPFPFSLSGQIRVKREPWANAPSLCWAVLWLTLPLKRSVHFNAGKFLLKWTLYSISLEIRWGMEELSVAVTVVLDQRASEWQL